jgi:hypothetical protein
MSRLSGSPSSSVLIAPSVTAVASIVGTEFGRGTLADACTGAKMEADDAPQQQDHKPETDGEAVFNNGARILHSQSHSGFSLQGSR